jgi:hypothetical protein
LPSASRQKRRYKFTEDYLMFLHSGENFTVHLVVPNEGDLLQRTLHRLSSVFGKDFSSLVNSAWVNGEEVNAIWLSNPEAGFLQKKLEYRDVELKFYWA